MRRWSTTGGQRWPARSRSPAPASPFPVFSLCCTVRAVEVRAPAGATHGQVLARFGHALSDPTRARLLLALRDGPAYPTELADLLGVTRQNLSNHLACLRGCGLVIAAVEGRRVRYELADSRLAHALADLLGVVLAVDPNVCPAAETEGCC
jgi:ArsR family transcriptional regulator, cadmium/lead-responsive transcriptional repressor